MKNYEDYISELNDNELAILLSLTQEQLKDFCESPEYIWYENNKGLNKNCFFSYELFQAYLKRQHTISMKYHDLRCTIDYLESELDLRKQKNRLRTPIKVAM